MDKIEPAILITVISILGTGLIALGSWLFNKLYNWIESLTKDVKELSGIVGVLGEKTRSNEDEIRDLWSAVDNRPTVKYRK